MPTSRKQYVQTIRAQLLGQRMRDLRDERGLTLKYVAAYLGVEFSTLARYERAEWPFRRDHVSALLDMYGVQAEDERAALLALASEAWRINHWHQDGVQRLAAGMVVAPFVDVRWLDAQAKQVCMYATTLVPQLLQTEPYAQVVVRHSQGPAGTVATVERALHLSLTRQQILDGPQPTQLTVLVEEAVLHRPVGGPALLHGQLAHLAQAAGRPNITVRVLPTSIGWHPGVYGGFTLYQMHPPYPVAALVEHLDGHLVIEAAAAERYEQVFNQLAESALGDRESIELIDKTAAQLT